MRVLYSFGIEVGVAGGGFVGADVAEGTGVNVAVFVGAIVDVGVSVRTISTFWLTAGLNKASKYKTNRVNIAPPTRIANHFLFFMISPD